MRGETAPTARSRTGEPVPVARGAGSVPGSATLSLSAGTSKSAASRRAVKRLVSDDVLRLGKRLRVRSEEARRRRSGASPLSNAERMVHERDRSRPAGAGRAAAGIAP